MLSAVQNCLFSTFLCTFRNSLTTVEHIWSIRDKNLAIVSFLMLNVPKSNVQNKGCFLVTFLQ